MPNAGFLVGHSALRRTVMGERSVGEFASEDELKAMKELLAESIEAVTRVQLILGKDTQRRRRRCCAVSSRFTKRTR